MQQVKEIRSGVQYNVGDLVRDSAYPSPRDYVSAGNSMFLDTNIIKGKSSGERIIFQVVYDLSSKNPKIRSEIPVSNFNSPRCFQIYEQIIKEHTQ